MKATQANFTSVARRSASDIALWFFCGPDEGGASAALASAISLLPDAGERVELSGADLKADPARLLDEARSTSLFGGARHIVARVAGEEAAKAVETFVEMADLGEAKGACPVFVIATSATDKSRTAKLLIDRRDALVAMFYPPEPNDVVSAALTMMGAAGLRGGTQIAERIAQAADMDLRLAQSEIDKLALYLDASPLAVRQVEDCDLDAILAVREDADYDPLVDAVLCGHLARVPAEIGRMREVGINPLGVVLALERRAAQMAGLVARRRPGMDLATLMNQQRVFGNRKAMEAMLPRWPAPKLDRLITRLADLHRAVLANSQAAETILAQSLAGIARFAAHKKS
ncbi:DNA polymerase III subunit delta [Altererythrobacter lauratis]|uniref:DNA-directed DNA polymerase n=1 Tax=Alteraurantiacibacter lauratis TaxID=2054627 RepID=A0ABV7ECB4_9SPHN